MLQIKDTLVSLDLVEEYFKCDLSQCLGQCCVEGEAGAPVTIGEVRAIEDVLPGIYDEMLPGAKRVVEEQGVCYVDEEGDLVTSIVDGRDCVFTTYAPGGVCLCLLEKAYREGRIPQTKPMSCHLYPVRLDPVGVMTAVNLHKWNVCKCALKEGRKNRVRAYEFLKEPLTRRFGREWYDELDLTAREYLRQKKEEK